ncbi:MAG: hypothetical protein ABR556_12200 [Pyrinomonadaceae bacterium]
MLRTFLSVLFILVMLSVPTVYHPTRAARAGTPVYAQENKEAVRLRTRDQLAQLLAKVGPDIKVSFTRSSKKPFIYVGSLRTGLINADSLEINISVTPDDTIGFRIYPHYKNAYINVDKVKKSAGLMRLLLRLSDGAFLFWGADSSGDIFTGYTFTLESGFPEEAIRIVLRSIVNSDKFIGEMRPYIDETRAP